jgi:hypothetical protein
MKFISPRKSKAKHAKCNGKLHLPEGMVIAKHSVERALQILFLICCYIVIHDITMFITPKFLNHSSSTCYVPRKLEVFSQLRTYDRIKIKQHNQIYSTEVFVPG